MDVGKCNETPQTSKLRFNKDSVRMGDDFRDCVVETGILAKNFSKRSYTARAPRAVSVAPVACMRARSAPSGERPNFLR
ncbi:hypothetical protein EVAR_37093_1 [Eumeta japonica]|uniref:Uncharacterized protein n=1 Tax=Eumeta variegata TaxID=151549 RepID=A0A4C1XMS5_EUMVA|nr:hypothetical protein EVAR_37093_1 [Eumeta japonica]